MHEDTQAIILADCSRGVYIPQFLIENWGECFQNVPEWVSEALLSGPYTDNEDSLYWEAAEYLEANCPFIDRNREVYWLSYTENGDACIIPAE